MHLPRFMQQVPAVLDHRPNIEACGFTNGWVLYSYVLGITREPACEKKQAMRAPSVPCPLDTAVAHLVRLLAW